MSEHDFGLRTDFYTFAPETLAAELAEFEILREVGKGSMGIVYECRRRSDGERVALKVLPPSLTLTDRALARFVKEGEVMARIEHPAIVRVYEHGQRGRLHFFAMQFVDGMTLEERLRSGPLPLRSAAEIGVRVATALQFAHDRGVVHRDIKPGNLILSEDEEVVITDFGLARETGTGSFTESGAIVGTPMYMAPEQILSHGDAVDSRADVYGLSATLYELCCGQPPFVAPTSQAVLQAVLKDDPADPRSLRPDLPRGLAAILLKGLHKRPRQRYGSAQEMAEDLQRFLAGELVQARLPGLFARLGRSAARHPIGATVLVVGLVAAGLVSYQLDQRHRAEQQRWLESAELNLSKATLLQVPGQPPISSTARRAFLRKAEDLAARVLRHDPSEPRALLTRARIRQRQERWLEALADLDRAARGFADNRAEILHDRIATLQNLQGAQFERRLESDLSELHKIDAGPWTLGLLANHLIGKARRVQPEDLPELLLRIEDVLARIPESTGPAAIAKAWVLHLRGQDAEAVVAAQRACLDHHGDADVHDRAAQLYERLNMAEAAQQEASMARMLRGLESAPRPRPGQQPGPPVDTDALSRFFEALGDLGGGEKPAKPASRRSGRDQK